MLKLLRRLYGTTTAAEFGPLCLEACQADMVRMGLSRKTINRRIGRTRKVFKWAAAKQMISVTVYDTLRTVDGLKKGRTAAKERPLVKSISEPHVRTVMAKANRFITAMIELQMVTGMRSGEMVIMRTGDIDRIGSVWEYRPAKHKNDHRDQDRIVYLPKRAQQIITPFLRLDPTAYLFSPAEARVEFVADRSANRKSPLSCGNRPGTNRKADPKKKPGERYSTGSYARSVAAACVRAFPAPKGLTADELKAWSKTNHISPHRLRHTAATRFRRESGVETARVLLGQKSIEAAEIYAEQDMKRARAFMEAAG